MEIPPPFAPLTYRSLTVTFNDLENVWTPNLPQHEANDELSLF